MPRGLVLFALPGLLLLGACFGGGSEEPEVEPSASQLYNSIALQELDEGRLTAALVELRKAQREAELRDDLPGRAACWNNLGLVHSARGAVARESAEDVEAQRAALREALACHRRALHLHADARARARTLEHLATVHLGLDQVSEARRCITEAATARAGIEDEAGRASHLLVQASVDAAEEKWAEALVRADEAERLGVSLAAPRIRAAALANRAAIHRAEGRLTAAREDLEQALILDRDSASIGAIAVDLSRLRAVCREAGDGAAARDYGLRECALRLRLADAQSLDAETPTQALIAARILKDLEAIPGLEPGGYDAKELLRLRRLLGDIIPQESP